MKLYLLTGRCTDDGISESSGGDISLVAVSITLMCTFATVVLFRLRNRVNGHVTVGEQDFLFYKHNVFKSICARNS